MHTEVWVQEADFSLQAVCDRMRGRHRDVGALVSFVGVVRDLIDAPTAEPGARGAQVPTESHTTVRPALYLEHYPGVTEHSITEIIERAALRWPLQDVVVIHRVGWLAPTDQIVLVAVASGHRAAAFSACAFLMDYLKTDAVFWKKERHADASEHWIESTQADHRASAAWSDQP